MYAVVRTGGKQYRVAVGDTLEVEKLEGNIGDTIHLEDVLLISNGNDVTIGQPTLENANVVATITGQHRDKKIMVFRYRPKKRIRVRRGHRQYLTRLEIQSIAIDGQVYAKQPVAEQEPVTWDDAEETDSYDAESPVMAEAEETGATISQDETPVHVIADSNVDAADEDADVDASAAESGADAEKPEAEDTKKE